MIGEEEFVGRDRELSIFDGLMLQSTGLRVWNIHGFGGIGKTKLVRFLIREKFQYPKAEVGFEITAYADYRNVLDHLVDRLSRNGEFSEYKNLKEELFGPYYQRSGIEIDQAGEEEPETTRETLRGWLDPLLGRSVDELRVESDDIEVHDRHGGVTVVATRGAKVWIGSPEYQGLPPEEQEYLHQRAKKVLTRAFIECANRMSIEKPIALFLDSFEHIQEQSELIEWLRHYLLGSETGRQLKNIVVVISGRQELEWDFLGGSFRKHRLHDFLPETTVHYLRIRGISDPCLHNQIHRLSHGHPFCVKLAANLVDIGGALPAVDDEYLQQIDEVEARNEFVTEFLVMHILNRLNDPILRQIVEEGVILRHFDGNILVNIFSNLGIEGFEFQKLLDTLLGLAFVESTDHRHKFHDLIRELGITRLKRIEHHLKKLNQLALQYYLGKATDPATMKIDTGRLKPIELDELVYHQFVSSEVQGLRLFKSLFNPALRFHYVGLCERLITQFQAYQREFGFEDRAAEHYLLWREGELYRMRGDWRKASTIFEQLLTETDLEVSVEVAVVGSLGILQMRLGNWEQAETSFQRSLELNQKHGNNLGEAMCLSNLGGVYQRRGDWDQAEKAFDESLKLHRELSDRHGEAMQLSNLGGVYQRRGDWDQAEKAFDESLKLNRELGDKAGVAKVLSNLGGVYQRRGDWDQAEKAFDESLQIDDQLCNHKGMAVAATNLGKIAQKKNDWNNALAYYKRGLEIDRQLGNKNGEAISLANVGKAYHMLGNTELAMLNYQQSMVFNEELGSRHGVAKCWTNIGDVYRKQRDWESALDSYQQALRIDRELGNLYGQYLNLAGLGEVYFWMRQNQQAFDSLCEASHTALLYNPTTYRRAINELCHHLQRLATPNLAWIAKDFARFSIKYWTEHALDKRDPQFVPMMETVLAYFEEQQQLTLNEYMRNAGF